MREGISGLPEIFSASPVKVVFPKAPGIVVAKDVETGIVGMLGKQVTLETLACPMTRMGAVRCHDVDACPFEVLQGDSDVISHGSDSVAGQASRQVERIGISGNFLGVGAKSFSGRGCRRFSSSSWTKGVSLFLQNAVSGRDFAAVNSGRT